MKKKIFTVMISLLVITMDVSYFHNKYAYADRQAFFTLNQKVESKLKIGIIGDSWVVRQDVKLQLQKKLADNGIVADLMSSGNPGATTKAIYENLFKYEKEKFSSKRIIEYHPKYCIVIAGVNDAATRVGSEFYSYHMLSIIKTLIHYDIIPVIVNLPKFGIEENFRRKRVLAKLANKSAELFLSGNNGFEIKDYRNQLMKDLRADKLEKKVVLLNFDEVCDSYERNKDLYSDPLHLNQKGYKKFRSFLTDKIINLEKYEYFDHHSGL